MAPAAYANFDLLIDRGPAGYRARVIDSPAGNAATDFAWPFGDQELQGFLARDDVGGVDRSGQEGSAGGSPLDERGFGQRLYQEVFAGAVDRCLRSSLDAIDQKGLGLRIRLRLDPAAPELAELPWEFLFSPGLGRYLAPSAETPVVRYLPVERAARLRPVAPPLVILAVLANPGDLLALDVEREWQHLQEAVAGLGDQQVRLERAPATWSALQARLREGPVHVLHFVGHGFTDARQGRSGLVFEDEAGRASPAPAEAFKLLLHSHDALRLVFLNACQGAASGRSDPFAGVAQQLVQQGVPAVVAMQFPISDAAAVVLSREFYLALAIGYPVDAALGEARAAVLGLTGSAEWGTPVLFSRSDDNQLFDLSQAARDPLFGLPPLPPLDLPDEPYHYLSWYRSEDAELFFGRGREIRDLYDRVTAEDGEPIVLFYGQSGVGKSSLLAAGLLPRLKASHVIQYERRDRDQGLVGTLAAALGAAPGDDLASAWRQLEAQADKPLLVVLDQVEEFFTRPNPKQPGELADLLEALEQLFADASQRPRGRLILGFRKEWLAEIDTRLAEHRLPRSGAFLERLGRAGIAEVVAGPQSRPRLRARYGLTVAGALPELIADSLLADRESPVAPMLAILLTDMWEAARQRSHDHPVFDEDLYHGFRARGLSLDDFLGRQLRALRAALPEVVDSGLALDLLAYHTTPLGTAEQRTLADLGRTYSHRRDELPALVQECRDLYLLVDPSQNQPGQPPASRLTHDTLAPHVRKRFDESDTPGQRARRILESRAVDWEDEKEGVALDDVDLALVQSGSPGMRVRRDPEERLLVRSVTIQSRRQRARLMWRGLGIAALVILLAVGGLAVAGWQTTRVERAQSSVKTLLNRSLTAQPSDPRTAVWLDLIALDLARQYGAELLVEAAGQLYQHTALLAPSQALSPTLGTPLFRVTFSPDDRWLAAGASRITTTVESHSVALWSLAQPSHPFSLLSHDALLRDFAFSPDSQMMATTGDDRTVRLWGLGENPQLLRLWRQDSIPYAVQFTGDGKTVVFATGDGLIQQCSVADDTCRVLYEQAGASIWRLAYHAPTEALAFGSASGEVGVIDLRQGATRRVACHDGGVTGLVFHPTGTFLVSVGLDNAVRGWSLEDSSPCIPIGEHDRPSRVRMSPTGDLFATSGSRSEEVRLWRTRGLAETALEQTNSSDLCGQFSWDGALVAYCRGSRVYLQPTTQSGDARTFHDHEGDVLDAAFSHTGEKLAGLDSLGQMIVWDLDPRSEQAPFVIAATGDPGVNPVDLAASSVTHQAAAAFADGSLVLLTTTGTGIEARRLQVPAPVALSYDAEGHLNWLTTETGVGQTQVQSLTEPLADPSLADSLSLPRAAQPLDFDATAGRALVVETLPNGRQQVLVVRGDSRASLGEAVVEAALPEAQVVLDARFTGHEGLLALVTSDGADVVELTGNGFQSARLEGCLPLSPQILEVRSLSADMLVLGTDGETICLWEITRNPLAARFLNAMTTDRFHAVATSPSGSVAAVAADKAVAVYEYDNTSRTWRVTGQFPGDWEGVAHMQFSQDLRYLLAATTDGVVRFVPLDAQDLADQACRYLGSQPSEAQIETFLAGFDHLPSAFECRVSP